MLIKKSVVLRFSRQGLTPLLVGLALSLCCVFPAGQSSQMAVGYAIQGGDSNDFNRLATSLDEPKLNSKNSEGQPAEIGTFYRRTRNGWEDSSKWQIKTEPVRQHLDAIHPAVWGLIVIGLVLLVLFGCSSQSEIDRLFTDLDRYFQREKNGP